MSKKLLYLEGACGISGDMTVAALLDLGASAEKLDTALQSLGISGFHYTISRGRSYSISGCDFCVHLHHPTPHREDAYEHSHAHSHEHAHAHEHSHEHAHAHAHEHRHLADVYAIIDRARMADSARALAKKIFLIVAEAEAKAHGVPVERVHFHEVGAVDSIVDIIGAAVLADDLGIDGCVVTGLSEGCGTIFCQHGELPVPVPAVLNIAEAYRIPLRPTATRGEMVTPTGIAIAAALCTRQELPAAYRILRTGLGLGKRDFGKANFLRAQLLSPVEEEEAEQIWVAEANIDDSTPEELGLLMDKLLSAGARDAWFVPCMMKKNRPAVQLGALCAAELLPQVEDTILRHSSTIGLRKYPVQRTTMQREQLVVHLPAGAAEVKKSTWGDIVRYQPEFESIRRLAEASGLPFRSLYDQAKRAAEQQAPPPAHA
ncbi:MAG: nickel pincer cofactor biosynthesis protein LarC [Akkermansiaceae bacterium]|nr:nickel pincer cofactor biosynthesis protein LarC [Akkermansiaceae bacterium]